MVKFEKWKAIEGYEGLYEVSSMGRIKSLSRIVKDNMGRDKHFPDRILVPSLSHGYPSVFLTKDFKHKRYSVHRLVAKAFIPNPYHFEIINHKDENKENNCVENLEWCSSLYNHIYGTCQIRKGEKLRKPVAQYTLDGVLVKVYQSAREAAFINSFHDGAIKNCCSNKQKTSYGFLWKNISISEYERLKENEKGRAWIARGKNGHLWIYDYIPTFNDDEGDFVVKEGHYRQEIDDKLFPFITWSNSPREILIK